MSAGFVEKEAKVPRVLTVRADPGVIPSLLEAVKGEVKTLSGGAWMVDTSANPLPAPADSPVHPQRLLKELQLEPWTIGVVSVPLATRTLEAVLGWADRRRTVAVVTTDGLSSGQPIGRRALATLVSHELGHLVGLRHCRKTGCAMSPVRNAAELAGRGAFCPRCQAKFT